MKMKNGSINQDLGRFMNIKPYDEKYRDHMNKLLLKIEEPTEEEIDVRIIDK